MVLTFAVADAADDIAARRQQALEFLLAGLAGIGGGMMRRAFRRGAIWPLTNR